MRKIPFCNYSLLKKVNDFYSGKIITIKTWSRSSVILPRFIGLIIYVHSGKKHVPVKVSEDMIGHKLGEFVLTRNFRCHPKRKESNRS